MRVTRRICGSERQEVTALELSRTQNHGGHRGNSTKENSRTAVFLCVLSVPCGYRLPNQQSFLPELKPLLSTIEPPNPTAASSDPYWM